MLNEPTHLTYQRDICIYIYNYTTHLCIVYTPIHPTCLLKGMPSIVVLTFQLLRMGPFKYCRQMNVCFKVADGGENAPALHMKSVPLFAEGDE